MTFAKTLDFKIRFCGNHLQICNGPTSKNVPYNLFCSKNHALILKKYNHIHTSIGRTMKREPFLFIIHTYSVYYYITSRLLKSKSYTNNSYCISLILFSLELSKETLNSRSTRCTCGKNSKREQEKVHCVQSQLIWYPCAGEGNLCSRECRCKGCQNKEKITAI